MSRMVKELMVEEMAEKFRGISDHGCVLVNYQGLSADEAAQVRAVLAQNDARMMVVKNRLFAIALERIGAAELKKLLNGPSAVVTGQGPVQAAKAVARAGEEAEALSVLGGLAESQLLEAAEVERLASLPDRETLLTQTITCMSAPARQFAGCLQGALRRLGSIFTQLKEQKQQQQPGQ